MLLKTIRGLALEAGRRSDTIYDGTPLQWALHGEKEAPDTSRRAQRREIAYLREQERA